MERQTKSNAKGHICRTKAVVRQRLTSALFFPWKLDVALLMR